MPHRLFLLCSNLPNDHLKKNPIYAQLDNWGRTIFLGKILGIKLYIGSYISQESSDLRHRTVRQFGREVESAFPLV